MKTIGQIFRDARKERGLTLRKAAELLGIDYTHLSKIENDRTGAGLELLSRFAAEFGQDIDMLLLASGRLPDWMTARILEKPAEFYRLCKFSDEVLERILGGKMADTKKYCTDMQKIFGKIKELDDFIKHGESGFKLAEIISCHGSLFDRFCPYKEEDLVQLIKAPEISENKAYGWLGAKHFLVPGAKAVVVSRGYKENMFMFGLTFESETWINSRDGSLNTVDQPCIYTFSEDFLQPYSEEKNDD